MTNHRYTSCNDNDSNTSRTSPSSTPLKTMQYGPITVRICQKPVPTLETGRRSRNLVLVGDDAIKREKVREKNREAAKKIKKNRESIENELNENIRELERQHSLLLNHVEQLHHRKQYVIYELNNQELNEIDEILLDIPADTLTQKAQHSTDMVLFDETLEHIVNARLKTCFDLVTDT